jgi:hypothetical protein
MPVARWVRAESGESQSRTDIGQEEIGLTGGAEKTGSWCSMPGLRSVSGMWRVQPTNTNKVTAAHAD